MSTKKEKNNNGSRWIILIIVLVFVSSIVINEIMAVKNQSIENIMASDGEKLVLLTKDNCLECDKMKTVLENIHTEKGMEIDTVNVDKLSDNALDELLSYSDLIDTKVLPAVLHISLGTVIGSYTGEADYDMVMNFTFVFKQITVSQYIELAGESEEHFIYIGRPTCGYCVQSTPWSKLISYQLDKDIYYINIDEETDSDLKLLAEKTNDVYSGATPLFLVVKDNTIIRYKEGAGSYTALSVFFQETSK
ncbi:MAG: glutaredoxin family protein [Bacilli bacterium]